jgi:hypothetical protein
MLEGQNHRESAVKSDISVEPKGNRLQHHVQSPPCNSDNRIVTMREVQNHRECAMKSDISVEPKYYTVPSMANQVGIESIAALGIGEETTASSPESSVQL